MDEKVLAIDRRLLEERFCLDNELIKVNAGDAIEYLTQNSIFLDRKDAEYNFNFKQIIPYIIIKTDKEIFLLKRFKKQTEKRLHNQYSIGIGGHINPSLQQENIILDGLFREIFEEIKINTLSFTMRFWGLLNDESTEVSKVHLGMVVFLELENKAVEVLEKEKMHGQWISLEKLADFYSTLESWSQIVYSNFLTEKKLL